MHETNKTAMIEKIQTIKKHLSQTSTAEYMDHHVRLSKYRIENLEADCKNLIDATNEFERTPTNDNYQTLLINTYYMLNQDIIKNLSYNFLGEKNINAQIIHVFKELYHLFINTKKLGIGTDEKVNTITAIIEQEFNITEVEIELMYEEQSIVKKIIGSHQKNIEKDEMNRLMNMHAKIYQLFNETHQQMNMEYGNTIRDEKREKQDKSNLIISIEDIYQTAIQDKNLKELTEGVEKLREIIQRLV